MPASTNNCEHFDDTEDGVDTMTLKRTPEAGLQPSSSKLPQPRKNADVEFLDYLNDDFFHLSRFELAINQMIRILRSSGAHDDMAMQGKVSGVMIDS